MVVAGRIRAMRKNTRERENLTGKRPAERAERSRRPSASGRVHEHTKSHEDIKRGILKAIFIQNLYKILKKIQFSTKPFLFARGEQYTPMSEGVHGPLNSKDHNGTGMTFLICFEPYF